MNRLRNESTETTDEESFSCTESESEDKTIEIEEYGIKSKVFESLLSYKIVFTVVGVALILISLFINEDLLFEESPYKLKSFVLSCGIAFISFILFGICLQGITMEYLKKAKGDASYCYYINETSFYISAFIVATVFYQVFSKDKDFFILEFYSNRLYVLHSVRILMFAISVLAMLKTLVKYVSMRFNYNMYINQIRKCILFDFFVSTISTVKEDEDSERITPTADLDTHNFFSATLGQSSCSFILQKNFRKEDASLLTFGEKRLLIKEFLNLAMQVKTYSDFMPTVLGKIKERANSKANKLIKKLRRTDRIKSVNDLNRYFSDKAAFRFMLGQLGLEPDHQLGKAQIASIIENTYKDRYVIKKNLKQINSAISRVYVSMQIIVYFLTVAFMCITASVKINQLTGIISAVFGTQFISKILSDNVMESIAFLFIIHPFDIGDRVLIRLGSEVENLVVAELNIFSTTFYKFDGTAFFVPNSVLVNCPICNIRRSGAIMETHSIQVSSTTDTQKLEKLREMLINFCKSHSDWYTDYVLVNYEKIEDSNKLYLKVLMQYSTNFQQYENYLKRKSEFINELNRCLKILNIKYKLPTQVVKIKKKASVSHV